MRPDLLSRVLSLLPERGTRPEYQAYYDMLRDYPRRGGKGIRSELLLASARAHGVQKDSPQWEQALWLAAALELFQNWVLGVWTLCLLTLGYLGGLWGVRVTAKHFARSGLA